MQTLYHYHDLTIFIEGLKRSSQNGNLGTMFIKLHDIVIGLTQYLAIKTIKLFLSFNV